MKRILIILLSLFNFAAILADDNSNLADDIATDPARLYYENSKSAINAYRKMVGDVSRDTTFAQNLVNYSIQCYNIAEFVEALQAMTEASNIFKEVYGHDNQKYAISLVSLARCYSALGNYDEAIQMGTGAIDITKRTLGANCLEYASVLGQLAGCYIDLGNYNEVIRLGTEALDIIKRTLGTNNPDYAASLSDMARFYSAIGNYNEAFRLGKEALEIIKRTFGSNNLYYAALLVKLASCYSISGNYNEAIQLETEALEIIKNTHGTNNLDYATSLSNLAKSYAAFGNKDEAIQLGKEALKIRKRILGTNNLYYATSLGDLARFYSAFGYFDEAIQLGKEVLEIERKILGTNHSYYATSLGDLANYNSELGNYNEAIRLVNEALVIFKRTYGTNHRDFAILLGRLANYNSELGYYNEAIRLETEALEITKSTFGIDHPFYATKLGDLACRYSELGNVSEAIRLGTEALEIIKRTLGTNYPDYATLLGNLANFYDELGNHDEAIRLGTEALEITKKTFGIDYRGYAISLGNLANYNNNLGNHEEAIRLGIEALLNDVFMSSPADNSPIYATLLGNVASFYDELGNHDKAIRLGTEALDVFKGTLGTDHPHYAGFLGNLVNYNFKLDNYDESIRLLNAYVQIVRKNVLSLFSGLTANERQMYWDRNKYRLVLNELMPQVIVNSKMPSASSMLYDNVALFSKGLLLSTELEMAKLIQESGDEEAEQMYSELRQNRQILNVQYSKPIAERYIGCDSLERVSAELERKLVSRVEEFGDFTRNLRITWKEVQEKLDDSDIAIEYLSYPENDSTTAYVALTLCMNDTVPMLTPLFTESQLKEVAGEDSTYQNTAADSLIWGTLASRLEGKSRIYFSAAGMLHRIGIEYLPSMAGKGCYRLSSTRELVTHKPSEGIKSAALFGGIDYDATYASIKSSAPVVPSTPVVPSDPSTILYAENTVTGPIIRKQGGRGGLDEYNSMRSMRYSVDSLPGSRKEIQAISALLKESKFNVQDCVTKTRNQASEESFKELSGQRRSLIHISTHGFYYDTIEAENKGEHLRMMLMGDDRPSRSEDKSLLRCGLCFAGANQFLREMNNPDDGQDEGILNALEIAQTDLRGLDLVVLSACQTALGDVDNGEGVFGLQRGFKKAGAQSIIMSLWKVDDDITQLLMTEFYRAWTSSPKMTKTAALKAAQEKVKETYPNPHDWAGFILLDALD